MKKLLLIPFASLFLLVSCLNSSSKINSKDFAGKYKIEIGTESLNTEGATAKALGAALGGMLMNEIQVVFYDNGEGYLETGPLMKYVISKNGDCTFTYKIEQDSVMTMRMNSGGDNFSGQHILRKVGDAYDFVKVINPKTKELEMTLVRQDTK